MNGRVVVRVPRPADLFELRVPIDLRLSPDGSQVAFCLREVAPTKDRYRHTLWVVPADGSAEPEQLTVGVENDTSPRWSPDGRTLAFLSDRGRALPAGWRSEGEADVQVWLLPMDRAGEARALTHLPENVRELEWSPLGDRICAVSTATEAEGSVAARPGELPRPDYKLIDRLLYQLDSFGYTFDVPGKLWVVETATGSAARVTSGPSDDRSPVWRPDGGELAFVSARLPDSDLTWRTDVYAVSPDGGGLRNVTGAAEGHGFYDPAWSPDGTLLAAKGVPLWRLGVRRDVWLFPASGDGPGENLTETSDLFIDALAVNDLGPASSSRLSWDAAGRELTYTAPSDGAFELFSVDLAERRVRRLSSGAQTLTSADQVTLPGGGRRIAVRRLTASAPYEIAILDVDGPAPGPREITRLMADAWAGVELVEPLERWHQVEGRRIQGWYLPPRGSHGPQPVVVEAGILQGSSLVWEWQCLAARGIGVYVCNPRGTQGYGSNFYAANFADWGDGPMRDILAGLDSLVEDGLVDPARVGVAGGSHGGYLALWLISHTDRFAAAVASRPVADWISEFLSGDIAGVFHPRGEYGKAVWEDPELFWRESPVAHASKIHTPLLLQHADEDLRCRVGQTEEIFTILRSLERPVRQLRVPHESHELTRSGAPFRRVYTTELIVDWFEHFLVRGETSLPEPRA